jgi:hypothetical protein
LPPPAPVVGPANGESECIDEAIELGDDGMTRCLRLSTNCWISRLIDKKSGRSNTSAYGNGGTFDPVPVPPPPPPLAVVVVDVEPPVLVPVAAFREIPLSDIT